ncbi:MAG: hypothetical protein ACE5H3_12325 [Planctomycetota bacterium]
MRIDIKTARILTSEEARETLLLFRNQRDDPLAIQESFRGMFPKKTAEALGELRALRRRAVQKFTQGLDMFFTKEQLEQASSEDVARYRAERFRKAGFSKVHDVCCGIGSDSIALARAGLKVFAVDKEPSAVHFGAANAEVCGVEGIEFLLADVNEASPEAGPIFLDPSRRRGSRRIMSPDDWSPAPARVAEILEGRPGAGIKLSPAVHVEELLEKFPPPGEIEVISLHGEAKETVFWYGKLASGVERRATALPAEESFGGGANGQAVVGELDEFLYDPDPSLIVAGLLGAFASENRLAALDPEIGYLTGAKKVESAFVDRFKVLACETLDPRKLKAVLRGLKVGRLQIRKRGIAERPATLEQRFLPKPFGDREVTLLATRIGDRHLGIVAEPAE